MQSIEQDESRYTISLKDVSKRFTRKNALGGYSTLKSLVVSLFRGVSKKRELPQTIALKSLTMRIPKGSSVGVIGRNGSGKSTLLKLITGIYQPDSGEIECLGRVSALIELGAGFHPDFTGRENVYLGGMIQGLSKADIAERFDDIVHFAELEDFIDEPVRTYSSGMFMRLGFSLAIHSDPEVLLIDEVLAVGDEGFITKCKGKISELRERGVTLMLVTHDLGAVERWCDEVLWLEKGEVRDRGEPRRVIDAYRQFIEGREEDELEEQLFAPAALPENGGGKGGVVESAASSEHTRERWGSREVEIEDVSLLDSQGRPHFVFHPGESASIHIQFKMNEKIPEGFVAGIGINHVDGTLVFGTNTEIERVAPIQSEVSGTVVCRLEELMLLDGEYWLDVALHRSDGYPYDYWKRALKFSLRSSKQQVGKVFLRTTWSNIEDGQSLAQGVGC